MTQRKFRTSISQRRTTAINACHRRSLRFLIGRLAYGHAYYETRRIIKTLTTVAYILLLYIVITVYTYIYINIYVYTYFRDGHHTAAGHCSEQTDRRNSNSRYIICMCHHRCRKFIVFSV